MLFVMLFIIMIMVSKPDYCAAGWEPVEALPLARIFHKRIEMDKQVVYNSEYAYGTGAESAGGWSPSYDSKAY